MSIFVDREAVERRAQAARAAFGALKARYPEHAALASALGRAFGKLGGVRLVDQGEVIDECCIPFSVEVPGPGVGAGLGRGVPRPGVPQRRG